MSIFEDQFWGHKNSGYDVLLQALNYGKESSKELSDFLKQRATLEDLYSKGLHKVSKFALSHTDNGTFYPLWRVLGEEVEKESNTHAEMSKKLMDLCSQVSAYCQVQDKKFSSTLDSLSSTHEAVKNINRLTEDVYKSEEKYISKCFDREKLVKTSTKSSGKDVEKAEVGIRKTMDDYKSVIDKYGKSKDVFLDKFSSATDKFQELESSHLENMKSYLDQYIDVVEESLSFDYQATIEFKDLQGQWTIEQLLTEFVRVKGTGDEKPGDIEQVVFDGETVPKKEDSKPVQNDDYYKEMISKIVPPPPPDEQLLINQKEMKKSSFLKRMRKEKRKKKQRNTSTASSDSTSLKSPAPSSTSVSGMDFDCANAPNPAYNRNVSVDSEGYSLRPNEDANNRGSTASFYSSSEEESDDDAANNAKFSASGNATSLKFSIRPPSMNLAPSMDDLSNSARNLTLEKSPRFSRRGLNASNNNDSSSNLTPNDSSSALKDKSPDWEYESPRMPAVAGGDMGGTSSEAYAGYGEHPDNSAYDYSSYYGSESQTAVDSNSNAQINGTSFFGATSYNTEYSYGGGTANEYDYSTAQAGSNYYSGGYSSSPYYSQPVDDTEGGYVNSSSEDDEAGYLPPPSAPPPRLPPSVSHAPFGVPQVKQSTNSVGPITPSTYESAIASVVNASVAPNAKPPIPPPPVVPTSGEASEFQDFQRERLSSTDSNSSLGFSNAPMNSSRGPSPLTVGTTECIPIAVAFNETVHASVYSGQPPSTWLVKVIGTLAVSFPAGFVQLVSSSRYVDDLKFSVLNSGQLSRAVVNSDIVSSSCDGVFESYIEYTFKRDQLKAELLKQQAEKPLSKFFNVEVFKYQIDAVSYQSNYLPLLLNTEYDEGSSGETEGSNRMVSSSSDEETAQKECSLSIKSEYNHSCICNNSSLVAAKPLLNVNILAKLDSANPVHDEGSLKVTSIDPAPILNEAGKIVWKIGAVSMNSSCSHLFVQWTQPSSHNNDTQQALDPFSSSQSTGHNRPVIAAQFTSEGQLLSGLEFDLLSPGYRLSLYKQKLQTGKYLCHC